MLVTTDEDANNLIADLEISKYVVTDIETNGLSFRRGNKIIGIAFYFPLTDRSYYLPYRHGVGRLEAPEWSLEEFLEKAWNKKDKKLWYKQQWWESGFRETLQFENVNLDLVEKVKSAWNKCSFTGVYYNASFDVQFMEHEGWQAPDFVEDVMLAVHIVFEDWLGVGGNNTLKWQSEKWDVEGALDGERGLDEAMALLSLSMGEYINARWDDPLNEGYHPLKRPATPKEIAKRLSAFTKSQEHMWMLPADMVNVYAENDVLITWRLRERLWPYLVKWEQVDLYKSVCSQQYELGMRMEGNGLNIDADIATGLYDEMRPLLKELNKKWAELLGWENFNFASNKQLPEALKQEGVIVKNTQRKTLDRWVDNNGRKSIIEDLLLYREASKGTSSYLRKWLNNRDTEGRVHSQFRWSGTITGRLASSGEGGNLQNIPSRSQLRRIKAAITCPPGWNIVQIDFGQIELRLAAQFANCTRMVDMFNSGIDLHARTAENMQVFNALYQEDYDKAIQELGVDDNKAVDKFCRAVAKTCNFGLLYGGTWRVIRRTLDLTEEDSKRLHAAWTTLYPEFGEYAREQQQLGLTRRRLPNGEGIKKYMYVQQPWSKRTRKYKLYSTWEWIRDKSHPSGGWYQNTRDKKAKDALNSVCQGQAAYIMNESGLRVCRSYQNDDLQPIAVVHDSLVFYLRQELMNEIPNIVNIMEDWPQCNPKMTVDVEWSDKDWHSLTQWHSSL